MGLFRIGGGLMIGAAIGVGILTVAPHAIKFIQGLLADTKEDPIKPEKTPRKRSKKTSQ
jgi:hypothetical protein